MINFGFEGKQYSLEWRYEGSGFTHDKMSKKTPDTGIKTICILKDDKHDVVSEAYTIQHKGDNHNKEVARKMSLTRLLKGFSDVTFRTAVWDAYFERKIPSKSLDKEEILNTIRFLQKCILNNTPISRIIIDYGK